MYYQAYGLCACFMLKLWFDSSHGNVAPGFGGILSDSLWGLCFASWQAQSCGCYSRCCRDQSHSPWSFRLHFRFPLTSLLCFCFVSLFMPSNPTKVVQNIFYPAKVTQLLKVDFYALKQVVSRWWMGGGRRGRGAKFGLFWCCLSIIEHINSSLGLV